MQINMVKVLFIFMGIYYIRNETIFQNALQEIKEIQENGGFPKVTVTSEKETRSLKQNRLLHTWFRDISRSTGSDLVYESGRCKLTYFVPIMKSSSRERARDLSDIIETVLYQKGYEETVTFLGTNALESTRSLTVKEFSEALRMMENSEQEHHLTDPETLGLERKF